jgi:hypothetical protein
MIHPPPFHLPANCAILAISAFAVGEEGSAIAAMGRRSARMNAYLMESPYICLKRWA